MSESENQEPGAASEPSKGAASEPSKGAASEPSKGAASEPSKEAASEPSKEVASDRAKAFAYAQDAFDESQDASSESSKWKRAVARGEEMAELNRLWAAAQALQLAEKQGSADAPRLRAELESLHDSIKKKDGKDEKGFNLSIPKNSNICAINVELSNLSSVNKEQQNVVISSENLNAILAVVEKNLGHDNWYKENPPKVHEDSSVSLNFKSDDDIILCASELAKSGQTFIMKNSDEQVLAYSNGDGKLYNGDKSEYSQGQSAFKPESDDSTPTNTM